MTEPTAGPELALGASMAATWPASREYVQALGDPARAFATPDLQGCGVREGLFGMPASASGQNAIVFPVRIGDDDQAVRCFTHPPGDVTRKRYLLLEQHLRLAPQPSFAMAVWQDRGVSVRDTWWPIVRMPWVPGDTLGNAVAARLDDPGRLRALAGSVRTLTDDLHTARMAHGDLQHGNLLVDQADRIRLVDYDAVWIPGAETLVPDERGHRSYQHPERIATGAWGPSVDTFSALVLHVSLLALAADPSLWPDLHTGENLVLTGDDLADPDGSAAFARLATSPDPEVRARTELLARCARAPLARLTSLEAVLDGRVVLPDVVDPSEGAPGAAPEWSSVPADWTAPAATTPAYDWDPSAPPPRTGRAVVVLAAVLAALVVAAVVALVLTA